ncbi:hypothetical protein KS4_19010 [Poriferisphaera corsica]|uniref:DUF4203 domain-containing protein n=1 Tax=Poriferisphaera corsica TaxID=2528020 RepID=A0A517YUB7_9BACT|nr:hypothetical protein [Poriferisphaera corsica]QDU33843.1 hypothetical protein KS4_19010 [Poriferisphaera corsica]
MNGIDYILGQSNILPIGLTIAMGVAMAVGLVLWLIGRSIAKPACVISGLVLGGIGGLAAATYWQLEGLMILPLIVGFALAGALLSGLLFRLWMGISGGILLAVLGPLCMFVWQGADVTILNDEPQTDSVQSEDASSLLGPIKNVIAESKEPDATETQNQITTLVTSVVSSVTSDDAESKEKSEDPDWADSVIKTVLNADDQSSSMDDGEASGDAISNPVDKVVQSELAQKFIATINGMRDRASDQITTWWNVRTQEEKMSIGIAAMAGGLIGLLFGLIAPYWAASAESALVGAILILLPGMNLAEVYLPVAEPYLPNSPRSILVFLGLITVIGVLIQWMIFRRSADK